MRIQKTILPPVYTLLLIALVFTACDNRKSPSPVDAPGAVKSGETQALETGADLLQRKTPLNRINVYLDGFHFYNGNMHAQMEAHHYVSQLNEDLHQAIIYDGNGDDAKIMGIEYIISERLFNTLPEEEKKLWHSHHYEVSAGLLIAPGIPDVAEHELMEKLISTYGKTIHTWHTDQERNLPVGAPQLMMVYTKDGQIQPELVKKRDEQLKISTSEKRKNRSDIPIPAVAAGANAWQQNAVRQFAITTRVDSARHMQH
jgi:hypothetical protein